METQPHSKHPPIKGLDVGFTQAEKLKLNTRMQRLFNVGYLMEGEFQTTLREQIGRLIGKEHTILFNSCTSAYEALIPYLMDHRGVKAICFQANVFPSPAFVAWKLGLKISWADIDKDHMCPLVPDLNAAFSRTPFQALALQWTGGWMSSECELIRDWCRMHSVILIEDCSQALGSKMVPIGGDVRTFHSAGVWGDVAISSLAGTKPHLHCGQGGFLCTNDPAMALFVFQQKNYGRTEMFSKGKFTDMGHNYHMTEMQAVVGTVMAETMEKRIGQRANLLKYGYGALTEKLMMLGSQKGRANLYKLMVELPQGVSKSDFTDHLKSHDIGLSTALYDFVTPFLDVWKGEFSNLHLPECVSHSRTHVCLPMHNLLTVTDAQWVTGVVNRYLEDL